MPIEYQPFDTFRSTVQQLVAPEDLAEQLVPYFRDQVGNALSDIQTLIEGFRSFNLQFITKEDVNEFCAASIFQGPVGKVTQIFAYKPGKDCRKFYYQRVSTAAVDCWLERQRCALCNATNPPSHQIYDSPYCNYWLEGDEACGPPYLLTEPEDDCKFRSLDDDDRIFAVGPDYKIYAAPRFPCGYNLLVQWQGINRKWNGVDLVPVDQQLREAVTNYVEHKVAMKEKDTGTSKFYFDAYTVNLRMLRYRYGDEKDTPAKRDCSAGIEELMAATTPLYPAYAAPPAVAECPECPECPETAPLHSAVYEPGRDAIYAVRGGTVFKLDPETGEIVSSSRYGGPDLSDSYIDYDSGRDKLWVTYSPNFNAPPGNQFPTNDKYIYKLNPDTFAIEQTIGIGAQALSAVSTHYMANHVIRNLRSNGVQLAFVITSAGSSNGVQFVFFNPDSLPGNVFARTNTASRWATVSPYPSSTDWQYVDDDQYNDGVIRRTSAGVFVESGGGYPVIGSDPNTKRIYGFAFVASSNKHYCANRSTLILKLDASANIVGTAIDIGRPLADVWNIRRNPHTGLLYAPTFGDNTVAVIDPSDDSVVIKTGFNSPWDVVFTPTKSWAVQHSQEGLREIV